MPECDSTTVPVKEGSQSEADSTTIDASTLKTAKASSNGAKPIKAEDNGAKNVAEASSEVTADNTAPTNGSKAHENGAEEAKTKEIPQESSSTDGVVAEAKIEKEKACKITKEEEKMAEEIPEVSESKTTDVAEEKTEKEESKTKEVKTDATPSSTESSKVAEVPAATSEANASSISASIDTSTKADSDPSSTSNAPASSTDTSAEVTAEAKTNAAAPTTDPSSVSGTPEPKANGTPTKTDTQKPDSVSPSKVDGMAMYLRGKREYLIGDYAAAVGLLADACELLTAKHGELAEELGDAYLYYGKALFANARAETGVLGDKIKEGTEALQEEGEDLDDEEEEEQENETETPEAEAMEVDGEKKEGEPETEEGGEEADENVDDLQLSWEVLEMAKVIFERKSEENKDIAIKLSEVYLALGENGLESAKYATASSDIESCLKIQRTNLAADDRRIAETLYHLGMSHSMDENYDEAVKYFKESIEQLEKRLETLDKAKSAGKAAPEGEKKDAFYTVDNEITEIKDLIQEIKEKITDMEDSKNHLKQEVAKMLAGLGSALSADGAGPSTAVQENAKPSSSTTPAKPVSNISHLVRKKRKNEEGEDSAEKKPKVAETKAE